MELEELQEFPVSSGCFLQARPDCCFLPEKHPGLDKIFQDVLRSEESEFKLVRQTETKKTPGEHGGGSIVLWDYFSST